MYKYAHTLNMHFYSGAYSIVKSGWIGWTSEGEGDAWRMHALAALAAVALREHLLTRGHVAEVARALRNTMSSTTG